MADYDPKPAANREPLPSPGVALLATGSSLPARVLANPDFPSTLDTCDEWIRSRTGISQRRIAVDGESTATLGLDAARNALERAGVAPHELDLIICATITPEMMFPSTACFIQAGLGCPPIGAFDVLA